MSHQLKQIIIVFSSFALALIFHFTQMPVMSKAILFVIALYAGYPIMKTAWETVKLKTFSIELLVSIAIIGALIIGEYVEASVVAFLFLFGAYLEARTLEKTRQTLDSLMALTPIEAKVKQGKKITTIAARDVKENDIVIIQSGDRIPVDGDILTGEAFVDEATITGESKLIRKEKADKLYSGTIVDNGYMEMLARKVGSETTFAKIIELVEEAQETKVHRQQFLEKFANIYTPLIIVLSIFMMIWTKDIHFALTFLVIACPGALIISIPVSLVAGIGAGAKHGMLVKGGKVLEDLAKIDVIIFDKTGTLTEGKPSVTAIHPITSDIVPFLQKVAKVEAVSEHHLGRAIVAEAAERAVPSLDMDVTDITVIKGKGICAMLGPEHILIGNRRLLAEYGLVLESEVEGRAQALEKAGSTVVFAAFDRQLAGIIAIADQVKPNAAETIASLHDAGVQTMMLTGDNRLTAAHVGEQVNIAAVHANLLPEDKLQMTKKLQAEGLRLAMVGDGINDAPALAQAEVGIAMGAAGTDVAMETADVVLMQDDLQTIPFAIQLAKETKRNMLQNMIIALGTVGVLLLGVLAGKVFLATGMFIHELSVLAVIINAIRLSRLSWKKELPRKGSQRKACSYCRPSFFT